jgi:hypothetical protein
MGNAVTMLIVGVAWLVDTLVLILMTFANALVITPLLTKVQQVIGSNAFTFADVGYVFSAIYGFLLICWVVLGWKAYQQIFSGVDYAQEYQL